MSFSVLDRRRAGVLVPVSALRRLGDGGIGDTLAVSEALQFCRGHGVSLLQLLPIQETIGDHSPYNPISAHALSPALLTLAEGWVPGWDEGWADAGQTEEQAEEWAAGERAAGKVEYERVIPRKVQLLLQAHERFADVGTTAQRAEFARFCREQAGWLEDYSLHRLLIHCYEGRLDWRLWRPEHQGPAAARAWLERVPGREGLERLRAGFQFIQWVAFAQWRRVRQLADELGVKLMGEISYGVGVHSTDVWANRDLFELDWSLGTPPLAHFDTVEEARVWGQNWGLPPYRWEEHRATGFAWLRSRVTWQRQFFHACRLDHLRGYFRSYQFPWRGGEEHREFVGLSEAQILARTGGRLPRFWPGPDAEPIWAQRNEVQGREIIGQIMAAAGPMDLVAELMGDMPDYMSRALEELPLANLAFPQLQLAADGSLKPGGQFRELALATWANHDNAPLAGIYPLWLASHQAADLGAAVSAATAGPRPPPGDDEAVNALPKRSLLQAVLDFADYRGPAPPELDDGLLLALQEGLLAAESRLTVLMISDFLGIPLRFNLPGSHGPGTWAERLPLPLDELEREEPFRSRIAAVTAAIERTGRLPW